MEENLYRDINKYVCKYEILIEGMSDYKKEFEIAKRIIGPRGKNMKEVVENCSLIERNRGLEQNYK